MVGKGGGGKSMCINCGTISRLLIEPVASICVTRFLGASFIETTDRKNRVWREILCSPAGVSPFYFT